MGFLQKPFWRKATTDFFINEANRLKSILCDKDGHAALQRLFQWFVLHTKEKGHFHVVMASSDSFFTLWLEKFVGSSRYSTYVLEAH